VKYEPNREKTRDVVRLAQILGNNLTHCEACLREREAEVTKLKEMLRLECVDSCCTDDDVRAEAKKVLSPALVDGDSHAIPDITEIVCILVKEIERLKTILDIADHCYCKSDMRGNLIEECNPCVKLSPH